MHDRKIINSNWTKVNIKSDFLKHALEIGFKTSIHTQQFKGSMQKTSAGPPISFLERETSYKPV